jgi:hypothetical protein
VHAVRARVSCVAEHAGGAPTSVDVVRDHVDVARDPVDAAGDVLFQAGDPVDVAGDHVRIDRSTSTWSATT